MAVGVPIDPPLVGANRSELRSEIAAQWRLALPLAAMHFGYLGMGVVDTAVLGHYSPAALAGAGISNSALNAIIFFGTGIVMGLDTLVPQALGAGDKSRARELFEAGVRLSLLVALPLMLLAALLPTVFALADVDPEALAQARPYVLVRLPSIALLLLFTAQHSYLQALGKTRVLVVGMILANVFNLVADWVLAFGAPGLERLGLPGFGLPAFGTVGVAGATVIASLIPVVLAGWAIRQDKEPRPAHDGSAGQMRKIFRIGLPVGLQLLAEVSVFALAATLTGLMGATTAAAHLIAIALASISYSVAVGISSATSVRVGLAVGAQNQSAVRRAGWVGIVSGAVFMGAVGVVFLITPEPLIRCFTDDPALIASATPLVRIAAAFSLFDATQTVAAGALRGIGDTTATFIGNMIGHYCLGVPLGITLAFVLHFGAQGLWWGFTAGLFGVALCLCLRFLHKTRGAIERR